MRQLKRKLISSGSIFEEQIAYSRAVVDGEWIFVSGTTGFDYEKRTISESVVEQAEQCFRNFRAVTSISIRIRGSAKPAEIIIAAGRTSPKCFRRIGQHS